jgi:DNA-binding LacI/PurR family transcriptional regulator
LAPLVFSIAPDMTAIVCINDFMAIGVLRQLREIGLRVAKDVSGSR